MSSRTTSRIWRRSSAVANARSRGAPRLCRGATNAGGVRGAPRLCRGATNAGGVRGAPRLCQGATNAGGVRGAPRLCRGATNAGGVRGAPRLCRGATNAGGCGGPFRGPPRPAEVVDGEAGLLDFFDPAIRVVAHGALDLGRQRDGLVPERACRDA